jgi:hypothetical protein
MLYFAEENLFGNLVSVVILVYLRSKIDFIFHGWQFLSVTYL